MVRKTEAIVLRIRGSSNTSHVVTWLSRDRGRMTTIIKGACRPKSPFLGQYDLFYTCELAYYEREREGLHIARECSSLARRDELRLDWRAAMCASYACDIIDRVAETSPRGDGLYGLLCTVLDRLASEGASMPLLLWFEARLLEALGLSPDLLGCPHCLAGDEAEVRFAVADGRMVCPQCGQDARRTAVVAVSRAAVAALRAAARSEEPAVNIFGDFSPAALIGLRRFVGLFMRYHLDVPLGGRGVAWGAVAGKAGAELEP